MMKESDFSNRDLLNDYTVRDTTKFFVVLVWALS